MLAARETDGVESLTPPDRGSDTDWDAALRGLEEGPEAGPDDDA